MNGMMIVIIDDVKTWLDVRDVVVEVLERVGFGKTKFSGR